MCGLLLLNCLPAVAQSPAIPGSLADAISPGMPSKFVLENGTPVKLRTGRTISSANAHVGDLVDFVAVHDVMVGNIVAISQGTVAWGTVIEAQSKRRMGRGGKLKIRLDSIQLRDGSKAVLRSEKEVKGGGHTTAMTTGMALMAAAYLPAAPALLFLHGKESILLQGTEVTAYISGNIQVDPARFGARPAPEAISPLPASIVTLSNSTLLPEASQAVLNQIMDILPRRVLDSEGNEGDMVNLLFIGNQEKLEQAFERAGWVETIRSKRQAVLHAARHPKNNVAMPMSRLFLFGRSQDYGYAINDLVSRATRRHHIRIWKTDYEIGGSPLWVGAATHDIGIEKDARKLAITHKIDPEVDAERDFVGSSLMKTQLVMGAEYAPPTSDAITRASTATSAKYYSDGQMLLLALKGNQELRGTGAVPATPR
jgi:hypothetical protein